MAKRGSGEGSIYKRSDGRWAGVVDLGWLDGKRNRKSMYAKTRKEVQEKLNTALLSHRRGLSFQSETLTVSEFLFDWLAESVKPIVRPRTYQSYAELVRLHLEPSLGRIRLSRLTPRDVRKLINSKLNAGLSPRRVQYIHAVLRKALSQAEKDGSVARNVSKLADAPKVEQAEISPFDPNEARLFVKAISGERLEALYLLAIAIGLRQAEILGLSWKDIDFDKSQCIVRKTLQRIDGEFRFVEPKTTRSRRTLALPDIVITSLKEHKGRQVGEMLVAGDNWENSDLVFTDLSGKPLADSVVRRRFYRILEGAGLRRQRFHDLRHACASLMISQGVPSREVMETLGHSTIAMTLNRYAHIFQEAQKETADKMGKLLTG
jgi:integrase